MDHERYLYPSILLMLTGSLSLNVAVLCAFSVVPGAFGDHFVRNHSE